MFSTLYFGGNERVSSLCSAFTDRMEEKRARYTLKYLKGIRGRAEMTVLMFKLAGVEYKDINYDFYEDWPTQKLSKFT